MFLVGFALVYSPSTDTSCIGLRGYVAGTSCPSVGLSTGLGVRGGPEGGGVKSESGFPISDSESSDVREDTSPVLEAQREGGRELDSAVSVSESVPSVCHSPSMAGGGPRMGVSLSYEEEVSAKTGMSSCSGWVPAGEESRESLLESDEPLELEADDATIGVACRLLVGEGAGGWFSSSASLPASGPSSRLRFF